jgi:hypothetical protein
MKGSPFSKMFREGGSPKDGSWEAAEKALDKELGVDMYEQDDIVKIHEFTPSHNKVTNVTINHTMVIFKDGRSVCSCQKGEYYSA